MGEQGGIDAAEELIAVINQKFSHHSGNSMCKTSNADKTLQGDYQYCCELWVWGMDASVVNAQQAEKKLRRRGHFSLYNRNLLQLLI